MRHLEGVCLQRIQTVDYTKGRMWHDKQTQSEDLSFASVPITLLQSDFNSWIVSKYLKAKIFNPVKVKLSPSVGLWGAWFDWFKFASY